MTNKDFYQKSYQLLVNINKTKQISENEILQLISGKTLKTNNLTMKDVLAQMLGSLQSYQGASNFIGYWPKSNDIRNHDKIKAALFSLNIDKCLLNYKTSDDLYSGFQKSGCDMKNSQKSWKSYSKRLLNGIKYISQFDSFSDFKKKVLSYKEPVEFPLTLSKMKKNRFFGFALACDWLKELGFLQYSKPDTHIQAVISRKLIRDYNFKYDSLELSQEDYFRIIDEIAKDNQVTPYQVDKVIWLICTGNFHEPINKKGVKYKSKYLEKIMEW